MTLKDVQNRCRPQNPDIGHKMELTALEINSFIVPERAAAIPKRPLLRMFIAILNPSPSSDGRRISTSAVTYVSCTSLQYPDPIYQLDLGTSLSCIMFNIHEWTLKLLCKYLCKYVLYVMYACGKFGAA